jgi:hypothetical protein
MSEREFAACRDRYHWLLEQEFLRALTPKEAREMERLGEALDRHFGPHFAAIVARLEALESREP